VLNYIRLERFARDKYSQAYWVHLLRIKSLVFSANIRLTRKIILPVIVTLSYSSGALEMKKKSLITLAPEEFGSLASFNASLAHKLNHSFQPNAAFINYESAR